MVSKYYVNADEDNNFNNGNSWGSASGVEDAAGVPGAGDTAILDGAGDHGDTNCTMSAGVSVLGIQVIGAYTSTLDNDTQAVAVGIGGVDVDVGTLALGAGKWTVQGNWLVEAAATVTRNAASVVELAGTTKTVKAAFGERFRKPIVSGSYTSAGNVLADLQLELSGSLTANHACTFYDGIANTGTLAGSSTVNVRENLTNTGTWSVATTAMTYPISIGPGTYGGTWTIKHGGNANYTLEFSGTCIFAGDVTADSDKAGKTLTLDFATNDASVEFQGDVTLSESSGTLVWSKAATGTVTFSGTTSFNDDTAGLQNIGDVEVTGDLTVASNMDCDDFTGSAEPAGSLSLDNHILDCAGDMDWGIGFTVTISQAGASFVVGGNFTANAQDLSGAAGAWTLKVTGTAVANGVGDVAHSDASGFTEIDASAGPWTDSGNNTNWKFGAGNPWYYYAQQAA